MAQVVKGREQEIFWIVCPEHFSDHLETLVGKNLESWNRKKGSLVLPIATEQKLTILEQGFAQKDISWLLYLPHMISDNFLYSLESLWGKKLAENAKQARQQMMDNARKALGKDVRPLVIDLRDKEFPILTGSSGNVFYQ